MNHYHHHTHCHYRNHHHYRTQWKRICRRTGLGQSSFVYPCALSPGYCLACPGCFLPRHGPFWPYHGPDPGLGFGMVHFFEIHLSQTHRYVSVGGAEAEQAAAAVVAAALVPAAVAAAVAAAVVAARAAVATVVAVVVVVVACQQRLAQWVARYFPEDNRPGSLQTGSAGLPEPGAGLPVLAAVQAEHGGRRAGAGAQCWPDLPAGGDRTCLASGQEVPVRPSLPDYTSGRGLAARAWPWAAGAALASSEYWP